MQGWVDWCYVKADQPGIEPATCRLQVQRPTAKPPRNTVMYICGQAVSNSFYVNYLTLSQLTKITIKKEPDRRYSK